MEPPDTTVTPGSSIITGQYSESRP